ncbi:Proton-dependent oligopeptide transporter family [Arabidopsis thaliana x Arabidopsis arenosa]|uniref:Proton-dependent oligopeptide transporter family n=1 Tax=Arabidopsis thaliana x Arabidopsis arenosa TaxID=1240361 RepID=A0A8T1ZKV0_9BRAS|nr:Proton-dependent oligopeptide transporter family [Arabidopsis thaliana x Arabidopsis arenosa]
MARSVSGDTEVQTSRDPSSKRGGWKTFPFIIATLLGLSIASFGWVMNLVVFLIDEFNIKSIAATQISNIVNGCVSMLPVVAAILADSFFGNIPVISVSAFISLLVRHPSLDLDHIFGLLETSTVSNGVNSMPIAIKTPARNLIRHCTLASAGANQYEKPKDQGRFFNLYFLTLYSGAITGATAIVYTQENASWKLGFGVCAVANLISFIVFVSGKRFYKHDKPMGSPFTNLIRVVVAATAKRKVVISSREEDYYHGMTSLLQCHPRASALKTEDDSVNNIWRLCSVQEVEDFKAVFRVLPLLLAIIFVSTPMVMQTSLIILQALVTDRGLGSHFKIPAGSLQVIVIITACIVIVMNNFLVYPMYHKLTHKPLTPLQKVGIGHVFIILSMAISAVVEAKRLKTVNNGHTMSVLWLVPPLVIVGIGETFQFPANIELFYREFPESLSSTATSLTSVVIGISFYLSTALITLIQRTTKWLPNDINHGRVDNVYWVLVIVGVLNFGYFLVCAWFYRYRNLKDDDQEQDPKDVTT